MPDVRQRPRCWRGEDAWLLGWRARALGRRVGGLSPFEVDCGVEFSFQGPDLGSEPDYERTVRSERSVAEQCKDF